MLSHNISYIFLIKGIMKAKLRAICITIVIVITLLVLCCVAAKIANPSFTLNMDVYSENGVSGHLAGSIKVMDNGFTPIQYSGVLYWNNTAYTDLETRFPSYRPSGLSGWIKYVSQQMEARRNGTVHNAFLPVTNDHTLSDLVSISIFEDDGQVYVLFFTSDECYIGPSQDAATNEIIKIRILRMELVY